MFACMVAISCFGALNGKFPHVLISNWTDLRNRVIFHFRAIDLCCRSGAVSSCHVRATAQNSQDTVECDPAASRPDNGLHRHRRWIQISDQFLSGCFLGFLLSDGGFMSLHSLEKVLRLAARFSVS
jgi:hypothetical protein